MAIDSCSWKRDYSSYGGSYWNKEWSLSDSAKQLRRNKIAEYNAEIARLENAKKEEERAEEEAKRKAEEEEAKKRFEEYWAEHAEEKKTLEEEAASLKKQVNELKNELENVPEKAEKDEASKQLRSLLVKRESLGIFKIKEKKVVQEEIDTASVKVKTLEEKVNAAQNFAAARHAVCRQHVQASHGRIRRGAHRRSRAQGLCRRRRAGERKARGLRRQPRRRKLRRCAPPHRAHPK